MEHISNPLSKLMEQIPWDFHGNSITMDKLADAYNRTFRFEINSNQLTWRVYRTIMLDRFCC